MTHALLIAQHHLVSDADSNAILVSEFVQVYAAILGGPGTTLPSWACSMETTRPGNEPASPSREWNGSGVLGRSSCGTCPSSSCPSVGSL